MNGMEENTLYPKISIVTPSYNQGRFIEKTILSVICQSYPNVEYIVVDAVSTDETRDVLHKYSDYIDVLIIEPDRGQTDALNKGFGHATGEILAYLNSDDCYASKDTLATVIQYFQNNPDFDVLYGQRNCIDEFGYFIYCPPYRPFSEENLYFSDYIPQECTFWRRNIFEKVGFYVDEDFHFAMDYELWLRFLRQGARFLSVEDFFGLFRSYQQQKSIEQWQSVGLPEIAKLHQRYLEKQIPEKEMIDYYYEHFFKAHPVTCTAGFQFAQNVWNDFIAHKFNCLKVAPLDQWSMQEFSKLSKVPTYTESRSKL